MGHYAPPSAQRAEQLGIHAMFFVVTPDAAQPSWLAELTDSGKLRPVVSEVFPLREGRKAFESGTQPVRYCIGAWPSARWKLRAKAARDSPLTAASSGTVHARAASSWMACRAALSRGSAEAWNQRGALLLVLKIGSIVDKR